MTTEKQTTFTPGPWRKVLDADGLEVWAEDAVGPLPIAGMYSFRNGQRIVNAEANANLIAAAPELYAELDASLDLLWGLLDFFEPGHELGQINARRESIRAALAKARGETNPASE